MLVVRRLQRPHEQIMQREIDQRRGDRRDQQREQQDVAREARTSSARSGPSSITISMNSAPGGALPHDAHDIAVGAEQQRLQRRPDGARRVSTRAGRPRDGSACGMSLTRKQLALVAHFDRDHLGADAVENLLHHLGRQVDLVALGCLRVEHERNGARDREPVGEPVQPEIRDRRHIDQHFRDHHEQDREQQKLAREAEAQASGRGWSLFVDDGSSVIHAALSANSLPESAQEVYQRCAPSDSSNSAKNS